MMPGWEKNSHIVEIWGFNSHRKNKLSKITGAVLKHLNTQ